MSKDNFNEVEKDDIAVGELQNMLTTGDGKAIETESAFGKEGILKVKSNSKTELKGVPGNFSLPNIKVEIRPLPLSKWHGKVGDSVFTRPKTVEALYDDTVGGYATGLTKEEKDFLEAQTGYDLSKKFDMLNPHPFWSSKAGQLILPNQTKILFLQKPSDFINYKLAKVSPFVAISKQAFEKGDYPEATHYIHSEVVENQVKANKTVLKGKAYAAMMGLSQKRTRELVTVLSERSVESLGTDGVIAAIGDLIETTPAKVLQFINITEEELNIRANLVNCLAYNILNRENGAIFYMGERIAFNYEDAVKWLQQPENQELKIRIFEQMHKRT